MTVAEQGAFVVYESDEHNNDYILTDRTETVYFGFNEEEIADLKILAEKINE